MAFLYAKERKSNNGKLKHGAFKQIHDGVVKELGISDPNFKVNVKTIRRRVRHNNSTPVAKSPVVQIEPIVLQMAIWKQEAGQPMTPTEGLAFANSLIDGMNIQDELKHIQARFKKAPRACLSKSHWSAFRREIKR